MINSDLKNITVLTVCVDQNIVQQTFQGNGNTNPAMPWSGINNFNNYIQTASTNFQNTIPVLAYYFSSSNPQYTAITSAIYNAAITYTCVPSIIDLVCPFANSANCATPPIAQFSNNFCTNNAGSPQNLITKEMQTNSTTWYNSIVGLQQNYTALNLASQSINMQQLVNSFNNLTSNLGSFET